jgi:DNA mismatch repair ATPase MutS
MQRGKLEEELQRVSDIADHLSPDCMTLFNESFQSTNEREGSEIGRQILRALLESRVKVFFVTHMSRGPARAASTTIYGRLPPPDRCPLSVIP